MAPPLLLASHGRKFIRRVCPDSRCARVASFLGFSPCGACAKILGSCVLLVASFPQLMSHQQIYDGSEKDLPIHVRASAIA